jgi:chromatin remodeling complex protein RSC6
VVKRLWEYIKAHNLQDPSDKRVIILDSRLQGLFPGMTVSSDHFKEGAGCRIEARPLFDTVCEYVRDEQGDQQALLDS